MFKVTHRYISAAGPLFGILNVGYANGQEATLRPLTEYLQRPDNRTENGYPFVRCADLFRGIFRYGGATFSDELAASTQAGNEVMMLVAFAHRLSKSPDQPPEKLIEQIGKEIEEIEILYADPMQSNYVRTGEAWGSDPTISSDLDICGEVAQIAVNATEQR